MPDGEPSTGWSSRHTGPRHAARWPRERRIAAGAIGGLVAASLVIWVAAVVLGGDPDPERLTIDEGDDAAATDAPTAPEDSDEPTDGGSSGEQDADGDGDADDDTRDAGDGAASDDEADDRDDADTEVVDFDGACSVEVEAEEADDLQDLRPWDFSECDYAPVDLGSGDRWIVVVASYNGDDVDESEAVERSDESDLDLLWSSHYASLNPNLWVLYEGPFPDEEAATEAADRRGDGAYPRVVSEDEDDRYCIAADGCVGGGG